MKESALDLLDLPFRIIHGTVGVLSANIPWSSIYTSPVVLNMSNILIVAVPDDGKFREAFRVIPVIRLRHTCLGITSEVKLDFLKK